MRNVIPNRDGTLTIECLDNVERLRGPVSLPPYALWTSYLNNGFKRGGLIDSSSIIDLAARAGGFTQGPQMWPHLDGKSRTATFGPILSVPLHGSLLPEFGMLDNAQSFHLTEQWELDPDPGVHLRAEAFVPGPHGYLALGAVPRGRNDWAYHRYWIDEFNKQAGSLVGTWCLGGWIYYAGPGVDESSTPIEIQIRKNRLQLVVEGSNGGVAARLIEQGGFMATGPFGFMQPGWNWVQADLIVENSANYAMRARVNDTVTAESRWSGRDARDINDPLSGLCTIQNKTALSDVYITKYNGLQTFARFTYDRSPQDRARVSWGRNRIAYTLRENGREAWDLATEVAAAEYGVTLFDERGRFVFLNYDDLAERRGADVRTFTLDDLANLGFRVTLDSVRNVWTVTTTTGRALAGCVYDLGRDDVPNFRAANGELLPDVFNIPRVSTKEWFIEVNDHVIAVEPFRLPYLPQDALWEEHAPLLGCMSFTGADYKPLGPNSEQKLIDRNLMRLWMSNGYGDPVGFIGPNNEPRFRIGGTLVLEDEPKTWTIRDETSVDAYGERVIELNDSPWLQDEWQTRAMLAQLVDRIGRPIPVADEIEVPGDPRVQLLDCVQLRDEGGFGSRIRGQVYGITRRDDADGIRDRYAVEVIEPPGPGMWDSGKWDSTFTWS
ncbi:hypothetical protein [Saccharopolyspora kobensis]|uniref:hypothetical protein n=1 Tax=Saccharopolyspora kobensis TaxID=146035 RepID=UPI0015A61A99|nr:hypothetical protein [Saccharopolyspora kobensis]